MSIRLVIVNVSIAYALYILLNKPYQTLREHSQPHIYSDRVLFCTPLRDAEVHLPRFFSGLYNLSYPHELVDIAFLVSESKDKTDSALIAHVDMLQGSTDKNIPYRSVTILHKDFRQIVAQDARSRHDFTAQPERRKSLAKARNWLWSASLRPHHTWVYWQDADVEKVPATIFEDLMKHNSDVIVPSVWINHPKYGGFPYDLNSWIESDQGRAFTAALAEDTVIVEGYPEFQTNRTYLANLRHDKGDPEEEVEIDAVGGVSILAKSEVFRAGCHFPAFSFQNQVETEAFGIMAKAMGFRVRGLPHYTVWHTYEDGL